MGVLRGECEVKNDAYLAAKYIPFPTPPSQESCRRWRRKLERSNRDHTHLHAVISAISRKYARCQGIGMILLEG
jgi:hypothetical protein